MNWKEILSYEDLFSTIENLPYATGLFNENFQYLYYNPAGEIMSGLPLSTAIGKSASELLPSEMVKIVLPLLEQAKNEKKTVRKCIPLNFGTAEIFLEVVYIPIVDEAGVVKKIIGITEDVTKEKEYEARLLHSANFDFLTGLQNRNSFGNLKNYIFEECDSFSLIFLDIDNFKNVNDTYGHEVGDKLIIKVTERLLQISKEEFTFRFGGDEFIILHTDTLKDSNSLVFTNEIIKLFKDPILLEDREIYVTISAGISMYPRDGKNMDELLKHSDIAMYKAKQHKNTYYIYNEDLQKKIDSDFEIEYLLHKAEENQEIDLWYQSIVDRKGNIIGAEGLARWEINGKYISPEIFIPILEKSNLILSVSEQLYKKALLTSMIFNQAKDLKFTISLNVSPRQIETKKLVPLLRKLIQESSLPPENIQLEVTENLLIHNEECAQEVFRELREMGVRLAIDDFGIGYSSLNYLVKFPFQSLKIDKSFIIGMETQKKQYLLVKSIIQLAHDLGLKTVAEGVETQSQWEILQSLNCDYFQGYYFYKPIPSQQFLSLAKQ